MSLPVIPKILSQKVIGTVGGITLHEQVVEGRDGVNYHKALVRNDGAILVLPITLDGKIVLERQWRRPLEKFLIELPAGGVEHNVSIEDQAKAELEEELGLVASEWTPFGHLHPAPGFCDEKLHCFIARGLTKTKVRLLGYEVIERVDMSVPEFTAAAARGEIEDAKTLALVFKALAAGILKA